MTAVDSLLLALLGLCLLGMGVLGWLLWREMQLSAGLRVDLALAQVSARADVPRDGLEGLVPASMVTALVAQVAQTAEVVARTMGEAMAPAPIVVEGDRSMPVGDFELPRFDGKDPTDDFLPRPIGVRTFEPGPGGDDFGIGAPIPTPPVA